MDKCVKRLGMGITSGKAAKAVENQRARKLYEEIFDEDSPACGLLFSCKSSRK